MTATSALVPQGKLALRLVAMRSDTNARGKLFGGWVVSQMDIAGGLVAVERAAGSVVTVKIEGVTFYQPAGVGDVIEVYTDVVRIGRTSLTLFIQVWARRYATLDYATIADGRFVFVAVDESGRPRAIPETDPNPGV